jgi:ribosomal 50S subunit-recycling heat shock protein
MRLDKFLKLSRLVKRRTLANLLCDAGGVTVNGKVAKASTTAVVGQVLVLTFGNKEIEAIIRQLPTKPAGNRTEMLTIVSIIREERRQIASQTAMQISLIDDD